MFDQTFVNAHAQTRRPWTVALSLTLQTALVAAALLVPILRVAPLDAPPEAPIWLPVRRVDLRVKPEPRTLSRAIAAPRPIFDPVIAVLPRTVPTEIEPAPDAPEIGVPASALSSGGPSSLTSLMPALTAQPPVVKRLQPTAPVSTPAPAGPVRISSSVQTARLIFGPKPAYPALAKTTHTRGTVKIQALIGRDGVIRNLQLISGPPLLVKAAMDAVATWRYKPALLNGELVEVVTEIEVNFTLTQ
ncbi:MAG TPA: TonB family protein [Bryobacteraceae bacterium]|nr:TonB family protein [Bryobacteraceae bacterium]